jgi:RNA polymerase sigma-70 factor, ECF subfamily
VQVDAVVPAGATPMGTVAEIAWIEFHARLRAFVARRVGNGADVDDIVQLAFLKLHRGLGEIRSAERIHAWLYSTARRAIADYYRSRSRQLEEPSGGMLDLEALAGTDTLGDSDGRQEVARCLAPVLGRLGVTDQEAIVPTEIQGLRLSNAAQRVSLSLPGMKSRVQRARRRLREGDPRLLPGRSRRAGRTDPL